MATLSILGTVIRKADGNPIADLYVEAWDKDPSTKEQFSSGITDNNGTFIMHLDEARMAELYKDNLPEIYFKVYSGRILLANTENDIVLNLRSARPVVTITVDYKPANEPTLGRTKKYSVKGVILDANFNPAKDYAFELLDKGLVKDLVLAKGKTKPSGNFEVTFTSDAFQETGKQSPDIFLRISTDKKGSTDTDVIYNASTTSELNYVIGGAPFPKESEFERLSTRLTPLLKNNPVAEIKLSERSNPFRLLQEKTGEQEQKLKLFVIAHRLSLETKLPPEFYYALLRSQLATDPALHFTEAFDRDMESVGELLKQFYKKNTPDISFLSLTHGTDATIASLINLSDKAIPNALDFAIRNNIVPAAIQARREEFDKEWNNLKRKHRQKRSAEFQGLLSATRVKTENVKAITKLYDNQGGDVRELLAELRKSTVLTTDEVDDIAAADEINQLTRDISLTTAVKAKLRIDRPEDVMKLAKLTEDDWNEMIQAGKGAGKVDSGPIDNRTTSMVAALTSKFPTAAYAGRLERDPDSRIATKAAMLKFFDTFPSVELHKTNLDLLFHKQEEGIEKTFDKTDELKTELKKVQRIFKLVPDYAMTKLLLEKNIHSAQSIYNLGEKRFTEKVMGSVVSSEDARRIFKRAERTYAASLAILGDIRSMEQGSSLNVLPDVVKSYNNLKHSTVKDFPDWETLFTSTDVCECEHCRSVYSPAAYLTDLLKFLNKRGSTTPMVSAKEVLFKRRPDIGEIDLNCDNSLVPIPYIDLVCETLEAGLASTTKIVSNAIEPLLVEGMVHTNIVLEFASKGMEVSKDAAVTLGPVPAQWFIRDKQRTYKIMKSSGSLHTAVVRQTHDTAAERKAIPEYINYDAYDSKLKNALYPISLPFDLSWEECRTYLEKIEISRPQWMQYFRNKTTSTPSADEVAKEYFALSPKDRDIIVTPNVGAQSSYWGGLTDIDKVSVFLIKSQLDYKQLRDLLRLKFINPLSDADIVHSDTTCDTEQKNISNLTTTRLDRINRFLRLWRKTEFKMWELDRILMNPKIGNGVLDKNFLVQLKDFDELRRELNLKQEEALAYFEDLNAADSQALYYKLFRNKVILDPLPDSFKTEWVMENPFPNPAPADRTITSQLKPIAAVLKLKEEEASQIQSKSLADNNLSLANISVFFRIASLSKKLRISAKEYYLLLEILNTGSVLDVFASPANVRQFVDVAQLVKTPKVTIYELAYLLLHKDEGPRVLIPDDVKIMTFITTGRDALQKIKNEFDSLTGLPEDIAKVLIGKVTVLDESAINETIQIFNGTFSGGVPARDLFLDTVYAAFINVATLKTKLNVRDAAPANQKDAKTDEAFEELGKLLSQYLQNDLAIQAVEELHTEQFSLQADVTKLFLQYVELQGTSKPFIMHWFDVNILAKDNTGNYINAITKVNFPNLFDSYLLFDKISLLHSRLGLRPSLVKLMTSNAGDFGVLAYNELPIASPVLNANMIKWQEYVALQQFSILYPDHENGTLDSVLKMLIPIVSTEGNFLKAFASFANWDEGELTALRLQLGYSFPTDYKKASLLLELDVCMNLLVGRSIKAAQVPMIINTAPLSTDAIAVKQLVKSKYDNAQWLNTSANIQESTLDWKGIRERKRDALVTYFTHHIVNGLTFKNTNELYGHYLLDVEMGSAEVTTRVLQASLSAQLFMQRCLMNLELEVIADENTDDGWKQCDWMKSYRVWEANRKVFLYPENWIEPELRPDKSYFFKELESDLMQNEINQQNVENAYLNYLEKLDNVARLDVSGFFYDHEAYTLHVFARTYDDPNLYYHRTWVEDRYWTPWEKLDLEINATHVIPVVINRRLYLYWPDFRERSSTPTNTQVPDVNQASFPIDKPYKYWEIRLCMSEYRNKKWTPKKISKTFATTAATKSPSPKEEFSFIPLDLMDICDKYLIGCFGNSSPNNHSDFGTSAITFFELGGCHGTPELLTDGSVWGLVDQPVIPQFERSELMYLESQEVSSDTNDILAFQQGNMFINHQPILTKTPDWFRIPVSSQLTFFDKILVWLYWIVIQTLEKNKIHSGREWPVPYPTGTLMPFFYEDKKRTFFVLQQIVLLEYERRKDPNDEQDVKMAELSYTDILRLIEEFLRTGKIPDLIKPFFEEGKKPLIAYRLKFTNFYHPYVCFLIKQLYKHGLDGIMKREVQLLDAGKYPELKKFDFKTTYDPTYLVNPGLPKPSDPYPYYPKEHIDFEPSGSYSSYNWELFFHAPLMLAVQLSKNQRFEEAQHWFHYILNPTDTSSHPSPQKFWNTKPFFERDHQGYIDERIDRILTMINSGDTELIKEVEEWRRNAFQPHMIAKFRTVAYQKAVVMKYLDNLIDWADNLFRSDRKEAINEATQLYVLASEILGPKPMVVPRHVESPVLNYNQLEPKLDAFGNAMINVENFIPFFETDIDDIDIPPPLPDIETFYFCIPKNDKLLEYWDKIADRLFKIRHSMNIDGIERQLALFDPPIDPGLLVKAAASGISIGAALAGMNAPLPPYRFQLMVQKANDFCGEVKSLGAALLAALEKKDAEALALLRSTQEIRLQQAAREIKKKQIEEAKVNVDALQKTKEVTEEKKKYYDGLSYMNAAESTAFGLSIGSTVMDVAIAAGYILAGGLKAIPQFIIGAAGFGGSPHATASAGGQQAGDIAGDATKTLSAIAAGLDKGAALASTQGSYQRRQEEWDFQKTLAIKELAQIDKQIAAAEIKLAMAERELENHDLQIEQSKETKAFMESKFTNLELYNWMIGQISGVYFQGYQLAYDVAKKAERCFRFELGLENSNFIQFGYWDTMKKGLLSGENLSLDLHRLESAFLDQNKREFEITKNIALSQIDPMALLQLKQNGECFVNFPEEIFDLDYPGHYFRRIKSVAVSLPCLIGPYTSLNCTLTLLKSRIRISPLASNVDYSNPPTENDPGFKFSFSNIQQMVTSNGQNDPGMFEANLNDERYFTFEGHGTISEWKIEINKDFKNFDLNTISDVILHMRYTARQGGKVLASKVKSSLSANFDQIIKTQQNGTGLFKLVSMKTDFPTEFHQLLHGTASPHKVDVHIGANHFPYWLSNKNLEFEGTANSQLVFVKPKIGQSINVNVLNVKINSQPVTFVPPKTLGDLKLGTATMSGSVLGTLTIDSGPTSLDANKVDDILFVIKYMII